MEPFATWEDVQNRLDFQLDEQERNAVSAHLEDMSEEARFHANREWPEPELAPGMVRKTVIAAVKRWADNMRGLSVSRAGDEQVGWHKVDSEERTPKFTNAERKLLRALGDGRQGDFFGTVELTHGTPDRCWDGRVPITGYPDMKTFPLYNPLTDGW